MKECNYGRIPPCYSGKKFRIHEELEKIKAWDETHEKVYELNKQMCDIGKTMSDAELMMDDIVRRAEENIRLYNDNNKYARLVRAAYESKFGKPKEKDIMKEKKTKKMTKAEAFEYLKEKKIDASINEREIQLKLFSLGVVWCTLDSELTLGVDYLLINKECHMTHCGSDWDYYKTHRYDEISADDILSIEIVEEKKEETENINIELEKWIGVIRDKFCCNGWSFVISASNFAFFSGDLIEEKRIKE